MKDAYEILRLKGIELSRVKAEVEALGIVAPLLSMKETSALTVTATSTRWTKQFTGIALYHPFFLSAAEYKADRSRANPKLFRLQPHQNSSNVRDLQR